MATGFADIHHHLLFGVDDGSKTIENSIAMVRMAVEHGTTHIVATPHANERYPYDRDSHETLLQQLRQALPPDLAGKVTLGLGCDFHVNFENTQDAKLHTRRYTINANEYLLIELPDVAVPAHLPEILYEMRINNITPILTHPERNLTLQRQPEKLHDWLRSDLLLQVTAGSVTGTFGPTAEKLAWTFLENNWVHFIASDAHNLDRRSPRIDEAYELIARRLGQSTADRLCITNPQAVFAGRPLPDQPQPLGLFDIQANAADDEDEKPGFWKRLFR